MKKIALYLVGIALLAGCASSPSAKDAATTPSNDANVVSTSTENQATDFTTLRDAADARGLFIGAAVEPEHLEDPDYAHVLAAEFNQLTPENKMKWISIHPEQDRYDFSGADALVEFAEENNMAVRGHTLVWHVQNPSWVENREWTRDELAAVLEDHIKTVVGRYKGRVYAWDVVNEAFDGADWRDTIWYRVIGPEYINLAFQWAHEADPDALLYYNDYGQEELGLKSNFLYEQVQQWQADGMPIDGVGFQMHLTLDYRFDYESLYMNLIRFADLGLLTDLTEIDIRIKAPFTERKLAQQADGCRKITEILLDLPSCTIGTFWGFTDRYSWIPGYFSGYGSGLLWDEDYVAKPAQTAVLDALNAGPVQLSYRRNPAEGASERNILYPFTARKVLTTPTLDGVIEPQEWEGAVVYPFLYNQLDGTDLTGGQNPEDVEGSWRILYDGGTLYGAVTRTDDITVTDHALDYENDNLEVFFDINGEFVQLRAIVGQDWQPNAYTGERSIVWNAEGTIAEFTVALPEEQLEGLISGWNIALSDNDLGAEAVRDAQLYPVNGKNVSWQGQDLAEIRFEGSSARPPEVRKILPPFEAYAADEAPEVDGIREELWDLAVRYPLGFNQLSTEDQTSVPTADRRASWQVLHAENTLYGWVDYQDDQRVTTESDSWLNDSLEVFLMDGSTLVQLRAVYGQDFEPHAYTGNYQAVWSEDGRAVEWQIELPGNPEVGDLLDWNIAVSDNDAAAGERSAQLYPVCGFNDSWQGKNLAELILR